jgi:glutamyl-tRNA synthetase
LSSSVRVRFAPAPTGFLHVGGARTALFNWLFARHHGGTLVLRIEDTDLERSREEWVEGISATLRWLGLDWDEGPHRQSQRLDRYAAAAARLLEEGKAYECYCTELELQERSVAAIKAGRTPGYDERCRDLTPAQRAALAAEGRPRSIRFRTPDEGVSVFQDAVRGEVAVKWEDITDFVIVRSTGAPVFFLANAVDDADMDITHVIRGEDLLDSTHRVLALREALGITDRPVFAHLPLLVGADRGKLSKRHGAVALEDFAARGYLPEALRNYLGLLGFSPEDGREILTIAELVTAFDLSRVTKAAAFFDYDKLNWMNGEYIRALPVSELVERSLPFARERYGNRLDEDVFAGAVAIAQERASTLTDIAEAVRFLFVPDEEFAIGPEVLERLGKMDRVAEILEAAEAHLASCEWTAEGVDLRPVLKELGIKPRNGLPAVYAAVEGSDVGLPLFDSIVLLGRERTLTRLRSARAVL